VTGKQSVVHLAGSVHALSADYYPLSPAFDAAFKDSDLLVEEVNLGEITSPAAQLELLMRGMLPADQSLDQLLSPATLARVNKFIADIGVPIEPLKRFKPWMLAIALEGIDLQKAGFDPELGLDKHFYDLAQGQGKAVQGFETAEYQISRFDQMTNNQQDRFLAETLKELESEKANVNILAKAWKGGDVSTVERLVLQDLRSDPLMYQRLLVERNRNWLPTLESFFTRRGHTFVVVGAAHLVGPDGLLTMLRGRGYLVEQQ
jgi:uncharacterized protein YbaP (TraB family)